LPVLTVVLCGCAQEEGTRYGPRVPVKDAGAPSYLRSAHLRFDDVPVPPGMRLCEEKRFMIKNARTCTLVYRGRLAIIDVEQFMKRQMPISKWEHRNTLAGDLGQVNMEFSKGTEECRIRLGTARPFPYLTRETTMVLEIFPR
jgi:hypothetical protein